MQNELGRRKNSVSLRFSLWPIHSIDTQTDVSPAAPHPTSCSTSSLYSSFSFSFHSAQQPVSSGTQLWLICLSRWRRETNTEPASPSSSPGSESQFGAGRLFLKTRQSVLSAPRPPATVGALSWLRIMHCGTDRSNVDLQETGRFLSIFLTPRTPSHASICL